MASDDELIEAAPCPSCRSPLTVSAADLGHLVECPGCGTQFRARRTGPAAEPPPPPRPRRDDSPSSLRPQWDDREDDDRPRRSSGRPRFDDGESDGERDRDDDRYPEDRRRKGTPGSLVAIAVMNFVYAGLLLLCGVINGIMLALGEDAAPWLAGVQQNVPLAATIATFMLVTALVMLFAGILTLQRKGWGLTATALGLAAFTFLLDIVNIVVTVRKNPGAGGPDETAGIVCAISFESVFWLGYIVTNGILLAKAGRHFR